MTLESPMGPLSAEVDRQVSELAKVVARVWSRDHTVWGESPVEVSDRLGWLDASERAAETLPHLAGFADEVRKGGVTHAVLVGMGGSSLYPEVLSTVLGSRSSGVRLRVLDSTDPAAVREIEASVPWSSTLLVPASKSGSTIETMAHLDRFLERLRDAHGAAAGRMVVPVTDPGSALDLRAESEPFRAVVHGDPDVGGRFSALSGFGLWPAALMGVDLEAHLAPAAAEAEACRSSDASVSDGLLLGAFLAAASRQGRDKLTILLPETLTALGSWIEQLVAESTGKAGRGLIPILGEDLDNAHFGPDRAVVAVGDHPKVDRFVDAGIPLLVLGSGRTDQLAAEVFRWEFATALVGAAMGINPFDQPDVASAKAATGQILAAGGSLPGAGSMSQLLSGVSPGDYVALLGFVRPGGEEHQRLHAAATQLREAYGVPVTVGVGPRYLHSTGQLHKGGPNSGVFAMVVGDDHEDLDIPDRAYTFGQLKRAQAAGDLQALRAAGRRAALVDVGDLAV